MGIGLPTHRIAAGELLQHVSRVIYRAKPLYFGRDESPYRNVIRKIDAGTPFFGCVAVFVGDDLTDEEGFEDVNELGGYSIRVGPSDCKATKYRLDRVSEVITWLSGCDSTPDLHRAR